MPLSPPRATPEGIVDTTDHFMLAAIALLLALGQQQSRALRWSAREIQRLIQW